MPSAATWTCPVVATSPALLKWLTQFDQVEACFDYLTDFEWFFYLARDPETLALPAWIKGRNIRSELATVDSERYWQENGRQAHQ